MRQRTDYVAILLASALLSGCKPAKPIHLGSLNESGTPSEFLAKLQATIKDGPEDVRTRQAVEGLKVSVDDSRGSFEVANNSVFYIDQLSFGCEIGKGQFVYFTWNVGVVGDNVWSPVDWLVPKASHHLLSSSHENLLLLHNEQKSDESLGASQLAWLIHNYKLHDCRALDIADATEDDPRKRETQASPAPDFIPDQSRTPQAKPWEKYRGKYIPLPDGSYGEFPKDASDDLIRSAVLKTFPDAFDLPDSFNITPPDQGDPWHKFVGCMEARRFAALCTTKSFRPTKGGYADYGGYTTPLPTITPVPKGWKLDPNQQSCNAAFEWKNYCSSAQR